jgi:nicotinate phosphoribosyltransferase
LSRQTEDEFPAKWVASETQRREPFFSDEPVVGVEGSVIDSQIIETRLLNILNFQSHITKSTRLRLAAGPGRSIIDISLRHPEGQGGFLATRKKV